MKNNGVFSTSLGQHRIIKTMGRILKRGRLAHAYILTGPEGIGKEAIALDLAMLLLCDTPRLEDPPEPCGMCQNCKKAGRGVHPDILILRPDGASIKIDQIRGLQRMISFAPLEAKRRVSIIINAHKMNNEASNALLKTLEEPPSHNHLFLTAISTEQLITTVVSRCQVLRCNVLKPEDITKLMKKNGLPCPEDAMTFISSMAQGSIICAENLLNQGILDIRNWIFDLMTKDGPDAVPVFFNLTKRLSQDLETTLLALKVIRSITRDLILLLETQCESKKNLTADWRSYISHLINQDRLQSLYTIKNKINKEGIEQYKSLLEHAEKIIEQNINRELIIEAALSFWIRKDN
ncbi:MAG: DNA polymerase III subunit delta' [Dissulfurimicrobium sp.]|uniref:DNA polymerase III subunit delta' n=1 Tax=Dissulfurimicrobium sp. TaxID=2022436 RepID=UPI00404AE643